jgi:hypothetical protein
MESLRGVYALQLVRSARGRRVRAGLILLGLAGLLAFGLREGNSIRTPRRPANEPSDAVLHTRVIEQLRGSDSYYEVVGRELRRLGYPARSVFNWRTPAHYEVVAWLSPERATTILRVLVLIVVFGAIWGPAREAPPRRIIAGFLMLGAMLVPLMLADAVVFAEACAGTAIGLSLALYSRGRWCVLAACLGIAAVFLREIAIPFAVTCGLMAIIQRRRKEAITWILGGVAYVIYYALHAMKVAQHIQPTDFAHTESWLQFQGLSFVLRALHGNGLLALAPGWFTSVVCALALAGTCAQSISPAVKWPLLVYFVFFSVAGHSFNFYWGWVAIPLWSYAVVHSDLGLRRLVTETFAQVPTAK